MTTAMFFNARCFLLFEQTFASDCAIFLLVCKQPAEPNNSFSNFWLEMQVHLYMCSAGKHSYYLGTQFPNLVLASMTYGVDFTDKGII